MKVRSIKGSDDLNIRVSLDEFKLLMKVVSTIYVNYKLNENTKKMLLDMTIAGIYQMEKRNYEGFTEALK